MGNQTELLKRIERQDRIRQAEDFLRNKFNGVDEAWIVGHKGDHHVNLVNRGLLDESKVTVAQVHSTLGLRAPHMLQPPVGSSSSYEGYLTGINPEMESHVQRVINEGKKVVLLMPFPNQGLDDILDKNGSDNFVRAGTVDRFEDYVQVEDKLWFAEAQRAALTDTPYEGNIIPWCQMELGMDFEYFKDQFQIKEGEGVYIQVALSGGGDGTCKVRDQAELETLFSNSEWQAQLAAGRIKVSKEISHNYPANGTGCIVPTGNGDCVVLVDSPSHKPVGLKELNAKGGSGVGNDWSQPFSPEIRQQYLDMTTAIGKYLYQKFGYTGLFGPDGVIQIDSQRYYMTETNPRWQGTTPYQTLNALMNDRIPLETIHYMVKLSNGNPDDLKQILDIIGPIDEYNDQALKERGGFYIKVGGPKVQKTVAMDLNGPWLWNGNDLIPVDASEGLNQSMIYSRRLADGSELQLPENHSIVWIKGPKLDETVGGELAPIGYIVGSGITVFDSTNPQVTNEGIKMYNQMNRLMFGE